MKGIISTTINPVLRPCTWVFPVVLLVPSLMAQGRLGEFLGVKGWKGKIDVKGTDSGTVTGLGGPQTWSVSWDVTFNVVLDQYSVFGQFWSGAMTGQGTISHKLVSQLDATCRKTDTILATGPVVGPIPTNQFLLEAGPGMSTFFSTTRKLPARLLRC